jgi:hypothetical protein
MSLKTPTRPRPQRPLGGLHRTRFEKRKIKCDGKIFFASLFLTAKLFTNSKFCMILLALIPVMNYNA